MKNSFVKKLFPFPPHMMYDRWISYCAAANNGIKYADYILVKYRQHATNTYGTRASKSKRKKLTTQEQFNNKLAELKTMAAFDVKDTETKKILLQMIAHFHRRVSLCRSMFFFRYRNVLLAAKNKGSFRNILFCLKMFFKPNY